ncbi:MAG TPA: hypothetical protein PK158_05345 [Spirochaetota bacterium]|nr:hypothetical protein [Spirochaetota bacterium]
MVRKIGLFLVLFALLNCQQKQYFIEDKINALNGPEKWMELEKYILEKKYFLSPPNSSLIFDDMKNYHVEDSSGGKTIRDNYQWMIDSKGCYIDFYLNLGKFYSFYIDVVDAGENKLSPILIFYKEKNYVAPKKLLKDDGYEVLYARNFYKKDRKPIKKDW